MSLDGVEATAHVGTGTDRHQKRAQNHLELEFWQLWMTQYRCLGSLEEGLVFLTTKPSLLLRSVFTIPETICSIMKIFFDIDAHALWPQLYISSKTSVSMGELRALSRNSYHMHFVQTQYSHQKKESGLENGSEWNTRWWFQFSLWSVEMGKCTFFLIMKPLHSQLRGGLCEYKTATHEKNSSGCCLI